jgi:hypothetical protein
MPFIDFSSGVWEQARTSAREFCTEAGQQKSGLFDPSNNAVIEMEAGLMKVVQAGVGPGGALVSVLGLAPILCGGGNNPIPKAKTWILFPNPNGFVRFNLELDRAGTVSVFFYASDDRTQLVRQTDTAYERGDIKEVKYSDICKPIRLVVVEVPFNALVENIEFEVGFPIFGRILFVSRIYCLIRQAGILLRRVLGLGQ